MVVLVIDNYDSFTYNLVQYLGELGAKPVVKRNDAITVDEARRMDPQAIVVSPGPCTPLQAGVSNDLIAGFSGHKPVLGVCLGHQCIGHVFQGRVVRAKVLMHGKTSLIHHDGRTIYSGVENPFVATRYHSLIVERESLPDCLEVTATTDSGEIMGIRHRDYMIEGVQFHPESILTKNGKQILRNFLTMAGVLPDGGGEEEGR
ncbi:MAG: aminodeoxychorismate/anthranilate synthase component II [Firmicutes bacterium]|nr:aminodeoxychorismate/anthranilate synthase component II [Bacillota bacterium]